MIITLTEVFFILHFQRVQLKHTIAYVDYLKQFIDYAGKYIDIPIGLGLINFIPQLCFRFDIVSVISNKIPKSNINKYNLMTQFCIQQVSLIFHFINILRFIKDNSNTRKSITVQHYNICSIIKYVTTVIVLMTIGVIQVCYIFLIFIGICAIIFSVLRAMIATSSFLICYSSFFSIVIF